MAEIKDYSVTADDNNATSPAGMPENMAPSGVNNSWRESFARVKRWYEDINGTKSTTGSSNAYVLAAARTVTAYAQGDAYLFRANHANTGAATLNVDSVGAVAIVNNTQSALAAGQIQSGGMYLVAYDASNSKFQLVGASATSASGDNIFIFNASPSATLENSTAEDTAGGRESTIQWKGLQSGSEESTLVKIIGSHDGSSDDQKGKLQIYTNDGSDGDSPTLQVTIDSAGLCALVGAATIGGSLTVTGVTTHGGNVVSDTDSTDDLGTTSVRWANLFVDGITATDQITATGFTGTLDGILGSGAAAAAAVTTLDTSGVVNLNLTTDSSSSTSGALIIDGGVGIAKKLFVGTDADVDGTLNADAMTLDGTAITTTATLSTGISNGNVPVFTSGVADDDFLRVAGTSIEGRSAAEVLSDIGGQASLTFGISNTNAVKIDSASVADDEYARFTANGLESRSTAEVLSDIGASAVAGSSSIVTTGALDAGSISSNFGTINNGSSAITTTGVITGGSLEIDGAGSTATLLFTNDATAAAGGGGLNVSIDNSLNGYLNNAKAGALKFGTSNVERMRLLSGGNLGIGTTTPDSQVEVSSGAATTAKIASTVSNQYAELIFEDGNAGYGFQVRSDGAAGLATGSMVINDRDTGTFPVVINEGAGTNTFKIDSAGRIQVNGTAVVDVARISVSFNSANSTGVSLKATNANGGTIMRYQNSSGTSVGGITTNGSTTAFATSSDYRLKENVDYTWDATARLKQLKPARFNFISDASNTLVDGFLAHEVSTIVPEAISGEKDATTTHNKVVLDSNGIILDGGVEQSDWTAGKSSTTDADGNTVPAKYPSDSTWEASKAMPDYQGIDQSKLVPLLVKTIQELEARITALEAS